MADVKSDVLKEEYVDSLVTIKDFRTKYAAGVSPQAINYAIDKGLLDYIEVGPRVRIIVLTEKTLKYSPNENKNRTHRTVENM